MSNKLIFRMKKRTLPFHIWIVLPLVLVLLVVSSISTLVLMVEHTRHAMRDDAFQNTYEVTLSHVDGRIRLLSQANGSLFDIARVLSSYVDRNFSSFSTVENKVGPWLFMALITISRCSHISYVGLDGLILSYYRDGDQALVVFSNTTRSPNDYNVVHWYSQTIDMKNGERSGNLTVIDPLQYNNSQLFHDALNGQSDHASLGSGFSKSGKPMLFLNAPIDKVGVLSLGITIEDLTKYVPSIDFHGGQLYLATKDGHILSQAGPSHAINEPTIHTTTVHVVDQNDAVLMESFANISCNIDDYKHIPTGTSVSSQVNVWGKGHEFSCAPIDIAGIQLVLVMAFPHNNIVDLIQKMKIIIVSLLSILTTGLIIGSYIDLQLIRGLQLQETFLRANLIKQKESVQQSERKSMNKSLAFASASHDIRTSLAGITGLIDLCRDDVPSNSELHRNLTQMDTCVSKLLGILNSILDTSKMEAGKTQLEEVEFDMAQVLEESVDIFHVVALKKDLEVIWDPCDFSILRSSNVKGDCKRLKQILDNLLGNAIKFTSDGHVVVRAWSKRSNLEDFQHSPKHSCHFLNIFNCIPRWLLKKEDNYTDLGALNHVQLDPNSVEFTFEVDDTGIGIPKEKRASVFENYVQVKDSTPTGQEGTGLGLGIVQSFVRLMGGEISIQDKEHGERGTCFRFNIFLKSNEPSNTSRGQTDPNSNQISNQSHIQNLTSNAGYIGEHSKFQSSPWSMEFEKGFKVEGIHCLLFVKGDETRRVAQKWMVRLGIKVWEVHHLEVLSPTLEKISHNLNTSGKFVPASPSVSSSTGTSENIYQEGLSMSKDEIDQTLPLTLRDVHRKTSCRGLPAHILVIIDLNCENIAEICLVLKDFAKSIHTTQHKVVWLSNLNTPSVDLRGIMQAPCDLILQKPFHGSRFYAIIKLLQSFGEENECGSSEVVVENVTKDAQQFTESSSSVTVDKALSNSLSNQSSNATHQRDTFAKPLTGINILLVEDTPLLRRLASTMLSRLGATVESSENGLEALNLVKKALREGTHKQVGSTEEQNEHFSYSVILMDCEMPVMDGYEATRQIRAEEKYYGRHIPIIALTAHATSDEEIKTALAGMDFHLTKPLRSDNLLEAIHIVLYT